VALDFLELNALTESGRAGSPLPAADRQDYGARAVTRPTAAALPHSYVPEPHHRIEIYRQLAQATDKSALESLTRELRDRFGPLPPSVKLLLAVGELKILASEKFVTVIEIKEDKLMLTRHGDFITLGGRFPRLTKKDAKARLKEIKKLLLGI
jgi:transcription-repair coupling factor (superfamily II helicase)